MKRAPIFVLALGISARAAPAFADASSLRAEARAIAERGDAQFDAGRCDKAIALWSDADARFHAPTIKLRIARCQAILGRVVDAAATLDAICHEPVDPAASAPFLEAKRAAEHELVSIRARIATLRISLQHAKSVPRAPSIEIDHESFPGTEETELAVDPGRHVLRVRGAAVLWERKVTLVDGEVQTYRLSLSSERSPPPPRPQQQIGFAIGGVGLASIAVGIGFAAAASITSIGRGSADRFGVYARAADLTLMGGGVLLVTSALLLIAEPRPRDEPPKLRVSVAASASDGVGLWIAAAY